MARMILLALAALAALALAGPALALPPGAEAQLLTAPGLLSETRALAGASAAAPTSTRQRTRDRAIRALKVTGVWPKLDALWVTAAHAAQPARLNWRNPAAFSLVETSAPSFTADRGYAGDGVASYLDTGFNPATAGGRYGQDSAVAFVWSRTSGQVIQSAFGWYNGTNGVTVQPRSTANLFSTRINQAAATTTANSDGLGLYAVNRIGASATELYKDGALLATGSAASTAPVSANFNIGHSTTAGFSTSQVAAAGVGGSLTAVEQAALANALRGYMTEVGAAP